MVGLKFSIEMICKAVFSVLAGFFLLLGLVIPVSAQQLEEGDWVGRMIHLNGESMYTTYQVRNMADSVGITMLVGDYGPFPFERIQLKRDSLRFTWSPTFELACSMALLDDGVYQGACMDPWGGFGGIVMAPPGSDVDAIDLHDETIESIAGWIPPPTKDEMYPLGENYPRGNTVEVHGRSVNYVAAGNGAVTIVLEAGLGDDLSSWEHVQKGLLDHTRVISYDRAGLGFSEESTMARTPEQIAVELRGLLREAGIPTPFLLVGHAEGALYIRRFAELYTEEVEGLVLVDPHFENQSATWTSLNESSWNRYWNQRKDFMAQLTGVLPSEFAEYAKIVDGSDSEPGLDNISGMTVTVLTGGRPSSAPLWVGESARGKRAWTKLHAEWVDAANGSHIVVKNSGPYIHQEQPEQVIRAILYQL